VGLIAVWNYSLGGWESDTPAEGIFVNWENSWQSNSRSKKTKKVLLGYVGFGRTTREFHRSDKWGVIKKNRSISKRRSS